MKLINAVLISMLVFGCSSKHHKKYTKKFSSVPIHTYQETTSSNDVLFWYIIYSSMGNNSCPCYSYSSPTAISDYSTMNFQKVETVPINISSPTIAEEPVVEVSPSALSPSTSTEVEESFNENFDSNDNNESGQAEEGFDESNQSGGSDEGSSGGSESGSSDGGSSDGGGGGE